MPHIGFHLYRVFWSLKYPTKSERMGEIARELAMLAEATKFIISERNH